MVMPNSERVARALDAVRTALQPICAAAWKVAYGDDWLNEVHSRDRGAIGLPDANDLAFLLKGMQNTWQEVWRTKLGLAERGYVSELREARNKWAHNGSFSSDDVYRILDTAERLIAAFSATEQVALLQALKRDHQRQVFEEQTRAERRKTAAKPTEGEPLKGLAPWREVITPHADVASGRFELAEFAADLYQVAHGLAEREYQDPVAFFERTYLTNAMRQLLTGAARRLSGQGGDPVFALQTNFGGGKTHSMISLYHLASGTPTASLAGIGEVLSEEDLSVPKKVSRAVVVGQWISPSTPSVKPDGIAVNTIWGEIAYQLAGVDGYRLVEEADRSGTSPGEAFLEVLHLAGPSVILIDEWVAYARQLPSHDDEPRVAGGPFDVQFTFAQLLTNAAKAVDNVVVLISLPESAVEVGGEKGRDALARLSNLVLREGRAWVPAVDDESFHIVRRRLFEPMSPELARKRDGIIKAFCDMYRERRAEFPIGVAEDEYRRRMELSYPIHPEVFDRLEKDWSTLDRFQRTRGVLRLMATVISVLWERDDKNLLIMPGTIPVDDTRVTSELTRYLEDGWEPVIRTDVDGANSLPLRIDADNKNLGRYSATRRVARAVYLASAPREEGKKGTDIKTITLGSAQPGESTGTFSDALRRLSNDATYLYVDGAQYWYSLKANITRLAADRANSNFTDHDADDEIKRRMQAMREKGPFSALHVFPDGPGDVVDDDDGVHLVLLPPTHGHVPNGEGTSALGLADRILSQRQAGPRLNRNLLVFCAANEARLLELRQAVRANLAWRSIANDHEALQLTSNDRKQTESKIAETDETVKQRILETYQHVLVPEQTPGTREIRWHQTKPSGNGALVERVARKLESEERLITKYGGTRVRMDLDRIPLWTKGPDDDQPRDIAVEALWRAYCQFPYLPRLANFAVLRDAVSDGTARFAWEQETFAYAEGYNVERWVGLVAGQGVDARPSGLIVHPTPAARQMAADTETSPLGDRDGDTRAGGPSGVSPDPDPVEHPRPTAKRNPASYYAQFDLSGVRSIKQLEDVLRNVVDHLAKADGARVRLTLEINASSAGFSEQVVRTVRENASQLGARANEFED